MEFNCCKTHVEHGLDVLIAKTESYPILTELSEQEKLSTNCDFCQEPALYLVATS